MAFFEIKTDNQATTTKKEKYSGIISSIIFSIIETRPKIAFATLIVANYFAKNSKS